MPLFLAAIAILGAGAYFTRETVEESAGSCTTSCGSGHEKCFERCAGTAQAQGCRNECIVHVHECLGGCDEMSKLARGDLRFGYSVGDHPPRWAQLKGVVEPLMSSAAQCGGERGAFTARFDVRPDGVLAGVSATAHFRPQGECIEYAWSAAKLSLPPGGEYAFVVRGAAPEPPPPPPPAAPKPAAKDESEQALEDVDYLAQLNAMQEKKAKLEAVAAVPLAAVTPKPPRILAVADVASEIMSSRGRPTVMVLYDSKCSHCATFLRTLSSVIAEHRHDVVFRVYSLNLNEEHAEFLSYVKSWQTSFEPVRISTPDPTRPFLAAQMQRLGLEKPTRIPYFVVFDRAGKAVTHGIGTESLPQLRPAVAAVAAAPAAP